MGQHSTGRDGPAGTTRHTSEQPQISMSGVPKDCRVIRAKMLYPKTTFQVWFLPQTSSTCHTSEQPLELFQKFIDNGTDRLPLLGFRKGLGGSKSSNKDKVLISKKYGTSLMGKVVLDAQQVLDWAQKFCPEL